jgi:predicted dehydrogenase
VADVFLEKATALAQKGGAKAYQDYREMLKKEDLDAVGLLTPPDSHRKIAEDVLKAGLPIFTEKPIAHKAADGRAMADAARKAGKLLMVAQCHRYHEPVRRAREIIQGGELGAISTYRNRFGYRQGTPDAWTRSRGGILLDNGSHSSYLFRFLAGPVKTAFGWGPADQIVKIEDLCRCLVVLETVGGVAGVIELDGAAKPCPSVIEVFGEKGAILINYTGKSQFIPNGKPPVELDAKLPGSHRFDREVEHFVRCVLGEEQPQIGAEEGVADLVVLEACYQSMRTGRVIPIA